MELVEQLKTDGIAKGLCQQWQKKLRSGVSKKRLIDLYIRGIDFCISNDFPTLDFIRENFSDCQEYGVFVDEMVQRANMPDMVLEGDCKAEMMYNGYTVSRAYVRHNSEAKIQVFGNACLTVDVFDNAHLVIAVAGTRARVLVNVYGDAKVDYSGSGVKVVNKNKKTY